MVDVEKAGKLITAEAKPLKTVSVNVTDSFGYVLGKSLKSRHNLPGFDNSAMDGFAVRHADTVSASAENPAKLKITRTIKAGDPLKLRLKEGEAAKIMTGSLVPKGADTVVRKEDCREDGCTLIVDHPVPDGENIRYEGEQIKKGAAGINKGALINPAAIGFILELGYSEIKVFRKPDISLLVTGEELLGPDEKLKKGKIRDTNTYTLHAAIDGEPANLKHINRIKDDYRAIRKSVSLGLKESDIVIITGGISVGDYDYIKNILAELGVEKIFWGVNQRPGGPLYFGKYRNKLVFGLPGNPASSLVCFYEYIRPAIQKRSGRQNFFLYKLIAELKTDLKKKPGKTHFLRGKLETVDGKNFVTSAGGQGSHMLKAFADANCLIVLNKDESLIEKGTEVEVHLLP